MHDLDWTAGGACLLVVCQAGSGPIVYDLVTWLQGASRALHVGFKRDTAAKEEQLAAEKRKVRAAAIDGRTVDGGGFEALP